MAVPQLSTEKLLQGLAQRLSASSAPRESRPKELYVLAASVLHIFDPSHLSPWLRQQRPGNAYQDIYDQTVPAAGWSHKGYRSLRSDVRRDALAWLWRYNGRAAIKSALTANPDRTPTAVQVLFEQWVDGKSFNISHFSYDRLTALSQLYGWGLAGFGGMPPREQFDRALTRRSSVAVFEHLVDDNFVSREHELQALRDHVGVVSPSMWARWRNFIGSEPRPPLVIWGPGGVGKTALVGKFLLEHVDSAVAGWFPFAYIPFDSETLNVREPYTILVAATAQLESQIFSTSAASGSAAALRAADGFRGAVAKYREERARLQQRASTRGGQRERLESLSIESDKLYAAFAQLLREMSTAAGLLQQASQVPVLILFDTFEEVYYRSRQDLIGFWRMLDKVQEGFPPVRIVVASRIKPQDFTVGGMKPTVLSLDNFRQRDAVNLLIRLGVREQPAQAIARQIGGNPLSLRLAASVALKEESGNGIANLETTKFWLFNVSAEVIQGQLYRRILDHIHDADVRALAHPGMVLRRVTKEIIRFVLAPTCGLGEIDAAGAEKLFALLRDEQALVLIDDDDSLRYRPEVREPVMALLMSDKPAEVRALQERAVEFYIQSEDAADRSEEIYHRLMLGQRADQLNGRWLPGVEPYLAGAVGELPVSAQIWLASRMSLELPPEIYARADVEDWERIAGRKALEASRYGKHDEALTIVRERQERTAASPLFAIEARSLVALTRFDEASTLLDGALEGYPFAGNRGRFCELLWLRAQVAALSEKNGSPRDYLIRLADSCTTLSSKLPRVQALAELVRFEEAAVADATRDALAQELNALPSADIDRERGLVRLALCRLGPNYASTLRRLLPAVVNDYVYLIRSSEVDVRPVVPSLRGFPDLKDAHRGDDVAFVIDAITILMASSAEGNAESTRLLVKLLSVENASLAGATLAGLAAYREPWESSAAAEVAA